MYYENITVDIAENNLPPVVYAKQGDTARGVCIELTENGLPYTIPTPSTCFVNVRRANGTTSTLQARLKDNKLTADFTATTTAALGRAVGDAAIYDGSGKVLSSFMFIILVVESSADYEKLEATDEYAGLAEVLASLQDANEAAGVAKITAEKALSSATEAENAVEQAISTANAAKQTAEQALSTANAAKQTAEKAVSSATEAENAVEQALSTLNTYEAKAAACDAATANCNAALANLNDAKIKKYGVSFTGSTAAGTRTGDAVGMVNAIAVDGETVANDFDEVPFFDRKICCCSYDSGTKKWRVNAYLGEPGFDWYGANGEVMYENTPFYYSTDFNSFVSVTATPCEGYELAPIFANGEDKVYRPVFNMASVDGVAVSRAGLHPQSGSLNSLMTLARTFNEKASTETIEEWITDWLLMTVEFATKDHQNIIRGACSLPYNNSCRVLEVISPSKFKLTAAQASAFAVGQTVAIGTGEYGENVASRICITAIEADGGITLEKEAPSLAVNNYVTSRPWITGAAALAVTNASVGSLVSNTDGKHPFIYRGKENPYANAYTTISNILLKRYTNEDGSYRYRAQYLPDPAKYSNGAITADYIELDFDMPTGDGYTKTFAKDKRYPAIMPSAVGANSTTYHSAYYYYPRSVTCALRVGGNLNLGRYCGSCFSCRSAPAYAYWSSVARLSLPTV